MNRVLVAATLFVLAVPVSASAGLISFRSPTVAEFDLTLYIVPPAPVTLPGVSQGYYDFEFDFDPGSASLTFLSVTGVMPGVLGAGTPLESTYDLFATGLDTGTATNVVVSAGELVSADLSFSLFFEMFATSGPLTGAKLAPNSSLEFTGSIDGLPFPVGTQFFGPRDTPEFGSVMLPDGTMLANAVSVQNRVLTTVPEPSSIAVFGCGLVAAMIGARRRRKSHVWFDC